MTVWWFGDHWSGRPSQWSPAGASHEQIRAVRVEDPATGPRWTAPARGRRPDEV